MVGLTVALYSPTVGYPLIGLTPRHPHGGHRVARRRARHRAHEGPAAPGRRVHAERLRVGARARADVGRRAPGLRRVRVRRRRPRGHDRFRRLDAARPCAGHHPGGRSARGPLPRRHVGSLRVPAGFPRSAPPRGRARGCLPVAPRRHAGCRGRPPVRRHDSDGNDSPGARGLARTSATGDEAGARPATPAPSGGREAR